MIRACLVYGHCTRCPNPLVLPPLYKISVIFLICIVNCLAQAIDLAMFFEALDLKLLEDVVRTRVVSLKCNKLMVIRVVVLVSVLDV